MNQAENFDHFLPQRNSILLRGLILIITGSLLTLFSAIKPDVYLMSESSSWLPLVSMVILLTGIMECMEAYFSRHRKEYYTHLQFGVFDTVIGIVFLTELNKSAEKLILLAACYLMIKGIFRVIAAYSVKFPNATSTIVGGLISAVLGFLLWQEWIFSSMWFICFCLSLDVMTRGWALFRFGVWLKKLHKEQEGI